MFTAKQIIANKPPTEGLPCEVEGVQYGGNVVLTNKDAVFTLNGNANYQNYALVVCLRSLASVFGNSTP